MQEIQYYNSTYKAWMKDYATALTEATNEQVEVCGNSFVFPQGLATGRCEFYEIGDGLGLLLIDLVFHRPMKFTRAGMPGNDLYIISYFLSKPLKCFSTEEGELYWNNDRPNTATLAPHSLAFKYHVQENEPIKGLQLFFNRSWSMVNLLNNSLPLSVKKMRVFINNEPRQIFATYSRKTKDIIDKIFDVSMPGISNIYLMEGHACKLVALFFNDLIEKKARQKQEQSEDMIRVIQLKESAELMLHDIPTVAAAAKVCLMSETKFLQLFKGLYKANYGVFFLGIRMKHAKELLDKGESVTDTGYMVGYKEVGSFSQAFKEHFGMRPKQYIKESNMR